MSYKEYKKVSYIRWQQAQAFEKGYWESDQRDRARYGKNVVYSLLTLAGLRPKYRGDDWNHWWQKHFDHYKFLPNNVDNAIELGCGPFTNIRLITEICRPRHLVLSDPLISTYAGFKFTFVSEMCQKGLCSIDNHPIEECPYAPDYFDLVVMINVLDHVRDAYACMEKAKSITRHGGILIIGQNLFNQEDLAKMPPGGPHVGHPIKVDHTWLDHLLMSTFDPVLYQVLPRENSRNPKCQSGTYLFAGKKRK